MEKRTVLALVLMALVIVLTPMLFQSSRGPVRPIVDSVTPSTAPASTPTSAPAAAVSEAPPQVAPAPAAIPAAPTTTQLVAVESTTVTGQRTSLVLLNPGAAPAAMRLPRYRDLRPDRRDTTATVASSRGPLLRYRLALGADTIALDSVRFTMQQSGSATTFTSTSPNVSISYQPVGDGYLTAVRGSVPNAPL